MQEHNWNDLKYLLALHRVGSFAEAGRMAGVDETTVARRVKRLELALGTTLLLKLGLGRYEMTDAATAILDCVESIERENFSISELLGQLSNKIAGVVRISSVPFITNRILVPGLQRLHRSHPDLTIELVSEARNVDLSKREADLAVRFSRPSEGGLQIKAQKLGEMEFDVFCASDIPPTEEKHLEWVGYDDANASLAQARWIESFRSAGRQRACALRVADLESALSAVVQGYGKSVLPRMPCLLDSRLRQVHDYQEVPVMTRAVWLLSHTRQADRQSLVTAKTWLNKLHWA